MSHKISETEWNIIMQKRLDEIVDNSNDLCDIFDVQGTKDSCITKMHEKTQHFSNISKDELLFVAENLTKLIYTTPLYDDFFDIKTRNDGKGSELIFFTDKYELKKYQESHDNCPYLCLRFRDIITLKNAFEIDIITVFFSNSYYLSFSVANIDSFYNVYAYENINSSSTYIVGIPSESYTEAIEELSPTFFEFKEIENVWLYHVAEMKNKETSVVDNNYEEIYDVFVVKMPENKYITIRDIIESIIKQTNNTNIKVVLYNSDMGMHLLKTEIAPIYTKE
ncbi:MAG: hypothetical protein IJX17_01790 [Clostridia bacterium]|nr:hypothetical protein [Clostridia bacterium]